MLLNATDFAKWVGVSQVSVRAAVKRGAITRRADGTFDSHNAKNKAYAKSKKGKKQPSRKIYTDQSEVIARQKRKKKGDQKRQAGRSDIIEKSEETNGKSRDDLLSEKLAREIARLDIKIGAERFNLIPRSLVMSMMGELGQIDTNELLPLASNLAAQGAGLFKVDDAKSVNKLTKLWEKRMYEYLQHRQKVLLKWLEKMRAEEIKDGETLELALS